MKSLATEVVGLLMAAIGVGYWIHPGAGLVVGGLALVLLAIASDMKPAEDES